MLNFVSRLFGPAGRARASADGARAPESPAAPSAKASRAGSFIAWPGVGRPVWTPRDYAAFAREGFAQNAVAHRCIRLISEAAASVPLLLYEGRQELTEHPLLSLLARPNARESGPVLMEALYVNLMIAGNAYLEAVGIDATLRELYALRPDRMRVVPGPDGWPEAYDYTIGGDTYRFRQGEEGVPPILHLKLYHPNDDHYGLSAIEAAAVALDLHNAASAWNKALLDNAARPSGALVYSGPQGANLTDQQFEHLKEEMERQFQGAANAGRPLLLDGGLDWKPLSLSPKDMDFIEAKAAAAREIALALGVPPLVMGLPGDNTYGNFAEANRAFWRQTVIPLVKRTATSLMHWLEPAFGEGLRLEPDLDAIEALSSEREALWRRIAAASFLTDDEKRQAVGYGAKGEAGALSAKYRVDQLRDVWGRFADEGRWPGDGRIRVANAGRIIGLVIRIIRNSHLANEKHPVTGIPFNGKGFPDFKGGAGGEAKFRHTGDRAKDVATANKMNGWDKTPEGYVWHHVEDGETMLLVPKDIHRKTGHTGSIGLRNTFKDGDK